MKRSIGWSILLALGIAIGAALGPYQRSTTAQQPEEGEAAQGTGAAAQLKEINLRLKKLEALLRSGDVRVTVVMNPNVERAKPGTEE